MPAWIWRNTTAGSARKRHAEVRSILPPPPGGAVGWLILLGFSGIDKLDNRGRFAPVSQGGTISVIRKIGPTAMR